jgi:hypothetical protein
MPESPTWIEMREKNKREEQELQVKYSVFERFSKWLFRIKKQAIALYIRNNRNLVAGVVLVISQQLTGGTTLIIYATTIFRESGLAASVSPLIPAMVLGFWLVLSVAFSPLIANNLPRKAVLLIGLSVQSITSMGFAFNMYYATGEVRAYVAIPLICLNIMAYQCGVASLMFLIMSELFNTEIRAFGVSQMNGLLWILNTTLNTIVPLLFNVIGVYSVYWAFSSIAAISVVVLGILLPETKKKAIVREVNADIELPFLEEGEVNI